MLKSSSFWALLIGCGAVLLTGALARPLATVAASAPSAWVAQSGPSDGTALFAEVARTSASEHLSWLRMTLWQRGNDDACAWETKGRFWMAPGERVRLELDVVAPKGGRVLFVSDGATLRHSCDAADVKDETWTLPKPEAKDAARARRDLLADKVFTGPGDLLQRLQPRLTNLVQQTGLWKGAPAVRISGAWTAQDNIPADLRPALMPRSCAIYVDPKNGWPFRIEWWGSKRQGEATVLTAEMEFRDVELARPLAAEECARVFRLP